ncbi:MAG: thioredoxin [Chitinivibrionales bacterium]|nr:thioredoxin [Chitinivibrionales bacterium]
MSNATTDATFKQDVLESDIPVLVDFWAPWCGPCRLLGPIIEKLGSKIGNRAKIYKLNVDVNPMVASQFGITGIPTVIIFKDGKVAQQFVGLRPEAVYEQALLGFSNVPSR